MALYGGSRPCSTSARRRVPRGSTCGTKKSFAASKRWPSSNIGTLAGNPQVIGYYSDNELGWWNAILWKMTLEQPASSGQRQRLVKLVREEYGDDWNALVRDFEPQNATNWEELDRAGMLWLRPGGDGIRTIRRFLSLVADRYYQLMRDTIRKFDPDALYPRRPLPVVLLSRGGGGEPAVRRRDFDQPERQLERRHVYSLVSGYAPRTVR